MVVPEVEDGVYTIVGVVVVVDQTVRRSLTLRVDLYWTVEGEE